MCCVIILYCRDTHVVFNKLVIFVGTEYLVLGAGQWTVYSEHWTVDSGQWAVDSEH